VWIILTKQKTPPVQELRNLMTHLGSKVKNGFKTFTSDLGGELAKAKTIQSMLLEVGYNLKTTGAHSSAQNGLAEKPNQDLARMMRSMLYGAGLGSQYWSYALRHAVYLKNRLPHTALSYMTPYQALNGSKPDLTRLRVFGARVHFMNKERGKKLDKMDREGIFMTFKGTDKISYVIDSVTGCERVATHVSYDEAHAATPQSRQPPMATALLQAGYRKESDTTSECLLKVRLLDDTATAPIRGSHEAAGLDIFSSDTITIRPQTQAKVGTKIALEMPPGYHGQIHIRSSYASNHKARIEAGTIDSDYRGEIFMIISNNGTENITITKGDRAAQLIIVKDPQVKVEINNDLSTTDRETQGFGSTGKSILSKHAPDKQSLNPLKLSSDKLPDIHNQRTTAAAATLSDDNHSSVCNIDLSHDPFNDVQSVIITKRGNHDTLGLILDESQTWNDKVIISTCKSGSPAARVKNWIKRLKRSTLLEINGTEITSIQQVKDILLPIKKNTEVTFKVGLMDKLAMHDTNGVPMMYSF
jgi:dUTP pyrophosphatase